MLWLTSVFWNLCHNACKWWFNNEMLCTNLQHKAYWLKITACLWSTHTNKNQYFHCEAWCFWIRGSVLIINILLPCLDKILVLNSHIICLRFWELTVPKIQWTLIVLVSAVMHNMTCFRPTTAVFYKHSKMILMNNDPTFLYHIAIPYCMLIKTVKPFTLPRWYLTI